MNSKLLILIFFMVFPVEIPTAIAQTPQLRQTLTGNPVKPVKPTPTTPAAEPTTPINDSVKTPTIEAPVEQVDPEEVEQEAIELENKVSPKNQNPFTKPDIDKLLTEQFNDDMWKIMRGGLPCLETTSNCLEQLQNKAVSASVLLRELDKRIEEANSKIDEARSKNSKVVRLSILTPALQYLLGPSPAPGQPQQGNGLIDNLIGIFSGKTGILNGLINVIGLPLFKGSQGANEEANRNAIAISDLQIKVAELQRSRAQLADTTREKVSVSLIKFDEARTDFQVAQVVSARSVDQFKVFELRYIRGNGDTEGYLTKQSQLDRIKADTYGSWGKMRRALFEIKLLVLGVKDAEI